VVYERNQVLLQFVQDSFTTLLPEDGRNPNEVAVAKALDRLSASDSSSDLIRELVELPLSEARDALSILSPEDLSLMAGAGIAVSQVQFDNIEYRLEDIRQGSAAHRLAETIAPSPRDYAGADGKGVREGISGKSGKDGTVPVEHLSDRWGFYFSGTGGFADLESTSASRGGSFATGGVTVGADYRVSDRLAIGLALGYVNVSSDLSRNGELDIDGARASLYATYYDRGFYLNGIVSGGLAAFDTKRRTFDGFAHGETEGADFASMLGTGYDWQVGGLTIGPVASLRYAVVDIDNFEEHGALGALNVESQSPESLASAIGVRAVYRKQFGGAVLRPEIHLQWQHEYLDQDWRVGANFGSNSSFAVHSPEVGRDAFLLRFGATLELSANVAVFAFYSGQLARDNYTSHSITAGLRASF
jgi:outer membrane autotransporter protein